MTEIRASIGSRAKESLIIDFINQTNLDEIGDKASVIDATFTYLCAVDQLVVGHQVGMY